MYMQSSAVNETEKIQTMADELKHDIDGLKVAMRFLAACMHACSLCKRDMI